jgi:hypothetical protein
MPLSLSDAEYAAVRRPRRRFTRCKGPPFLQALAKELELHPIVGPGLVHRLAADVQRRYVIAPERGTAAAPREQLARQVWR